MAGDRRLARQIRVGLDEAQSESEPAMGRASMNTSQKESCDLLDQIWYRKTIRQHVREFACLIGIILCICGMMFSYKRSDPWFAVLFVVLTLSVLAVGYLTPRILHPAWRLWMVFAERLGIIVSTVIPVSYTHLTLPTK